MEKAFPHEARLRLPYWDQEKNERIIVNLLAGETSSVKELKTGSRPEGFTLFYEYVHDTPDLDIMFLCGGEWCVHVSGKCIVNETTEETYLEMNTDGCAPGYCQIHIKGTHKLLRPAQKCSYIYLRIIENALKWAFTISYLVGTLFRDPTERMKVLMSGVGFCISFALTAKLTRHILRRVFSPYLFLEHHGKIIVLPQEFLRQLILPFHIKSEKFQGPSHATLDLDVVPGLICLQPFPCIGQYLMRARSSLWPTPNALIQIASVPGMIVPTGNKSAKGAYTWSSPVCLSMCEGSEHTSLSVTKRKIILDVRISKLLVLVSMSGISFGVYINNISALV